MKLRLRGASGVRGKYACGNYSQERPTELTGCQGVNKRRVGKEEQRVGVRTMNEGCLNIKVAACVFFKIVNAAT